MEKNSVARFKKDLSFFVLEFLKLKAEKKKNISVLVEQRKTIKVEKLLKSDKNKKKFHTFANLNELRFKVFSKQQGNSYTDNSKRFYFIQLLINSTNSSLKLQFENGTKMLLHQCNMKKIENIISGVVLFKKLRGKTNKFSFKSVLFYRRTNKTKKRFLQSETMKETYDLVISFFHLFKNILLKYNIINSFYFLNLQSGFSKKKISMSRIRTACEMLKQILTCTVQKGNISILSKLNKIFYSLIPCKHVTNVLTNTRTLQDLKQKIELLECIEDNLSYHAIYLKNIFLKVYDMHLKPFRFNLKHLKYNNRDYKLIIEMIGRNHLTEKNNCKIKIRSIFELYTDKTEKEQKLFNNLRNHKLLWLQTATNDNHDFPKSVFKGISSLRSLFNEGLEFSDIISRNRNFCHPTNENPYAILILCDVSLGRIFKRKKNTKYQFPKYFHSIWNYCQIVPMWKQTENHNDYTKSIVDLNNRPNLFCNHFKVRDIAQVEAKFLVLVRIDF